MLTNELEKCKQKYFQMYVTDINIILKTHNFPLSTILYT